MDYRWTLQVFETRLRSYTYFDIDDDEESIYLITIGLCVLNLNIPTYIYISEYYTKNLAIHNIMTSNKTVKSLTRQKQNLWMSYKKTLF